jgi:formylglycine-generating enzyme required for sulfatase activity
LAGFNSWNGLELYELCIKTLVETWREARSEAGAVGRPLRVADEIKVLAPFALWLQEQAPGPGGAARRAAVRAQLVELLMPQVKSDRAAAETEAEAFLELGQKQTGLLVERGEGWFGFFHPTFKEYLAARACVLSGQLSLDKTWTVLQPHLDDALWREVILLTVGYKAIIQSEQEAASYLVEHILAEPDRSEDARGGNVVLAGRCLIDIGRSGVSDVCWDAVVTQLVPIMQNRPEAFDYSTPTRYAAAETLDRLGWLPRDIDAFVPIFDSKSKIKNPKFYIAKYPLTNHQFARFIEAGGYENPKYWGGEKSAAWRWRMSEHNVDWRGEGSVTQPEYWDHPRFGKTRRGYPVVGISWYEANAYCAWFTEQLRVPGYELQVWENDQRSTLNSELATSEARLPTDEEWILAAGGAEGNRYPWGPEWDETCANTGESNLGGTSPVGMYPSGQSCPAGVWDMAGNVWEWLISEYSGGYALRGGSWHYFRNLAHVGPRRGLNANASHHDVGVRVVLFVP